MPTTNKRVNLTMTDEVYEKLQKYKEKSSIMSDATACLQLVVLQLRAQENTDQMLKVIQGLSMEQLNDLSKDGFNFMKEKMSEKE
ncbi:MAG: hypothetical protein EOM54_00005 [Clostridia bacterium]|nr:hypothetical protein [Clostridia bacterium]